jgi:hypothetical protein
MKIVSAFARLALYVALLVGGIALMVVFVSPQAAIAAFSAALVVTVLREVRK